MAPEAPAEGMPASASSHPPSRTHLLQVAVPGAGPSSLNYNEDRLKSKRPGLPVGTSGGGYNASPLDRLSGAARLTDALPNKEST